METEEKQTDTDTPLTKTEKGKEIIHGQFKRFDRAILSGSWLGILIASSGFALDYLLNLTLSQWLSPADLGDYSVAVSIAIFGAMIALFGSDQALMKFLPNYLEDKNWAKAKGVLAFSFGLVFFSSMVIICIVFLVILIFFENAEGHPSILALCALPFVALTLLSSKALRAFKHIALSAAPMSIAIPVLIIIGGYLLVDQKERITDWHLVGIFTISFFIVMTFQLISLGKHYFGDISKSSSVYDTKDWCQTALSLMIASVLFLAMEQMGLYMTELLASEEDVAIFAVIIKHARFLLIIFVAVNLTVLPFISPALRRNDKAEMQRLYGTSMHVVFWGGLIPLCLFIFGGEGLLRAFGEDYAIGYNGLLILMSAYYLNFVCGFSVPFLQYAGHRSLVNISILTALIVEIILFAVFVPSHGFIGAVWSITFTLCALSIFLTFKSWQLLGLAPLRLHK